MPADGAVLVTGGAGYVGSHVVWALVEAGYRIVVLDDLSTGFRDAVAAEATFVEGDAGDMALVDTLIGEQGIDAVVHLAASSLVEESMARPLEYYRNNVVKTRELIAACLAHDIRHFVFSSSAAVYGAPAEQPILEDSPKVPANPYGRSKLMCEWMLQDAGAFAALRYVAMRYFNVAGADPSGRTGESTVHATHLIKVASQAVVGIRDHIEIYGEDYPTPDGTCVRDYIHASDVADAHVAALVHLRGGGESLTLNCGYQRGYSVREVLAAVERVAGRSLDIRSASRRPGDPPELIAATARIVETLGWRPRHDDLDVIVQSAIDWEKKLATKVE